MPERLRRGYPVGILIGLSQKKSSIWKIYSETAKLEKNIDINREDVKSLYGRHEEIIDFIKPTVKSGITNIIIASPVRSSFTNELLDHVKKRHKWLVEGKNSVTFGVVVGEADTTKSAFELVKGKDFKKILNEVVSQDSEQIQRELEHGLKEYEILYTIDEIQNQIRKEVKPSLILITDLFYESHKRNRRLQSFLQVAQNNLIKTRILKSDSPVGNRVQQFGGLIALID